MAGMADLFDWLKQTHRVHGPLRGADGIVRLGPLAAWPDPLFAGLPLLPPKKYLLPPRETIWSESDGHPEPEANTRPLALVGIAPCDLAGIAYLDRVLADDPSYRSRRGGLFLVGCACEPDQDCCCPPWSSLPPCDLFLTAAGAFFGSPAGRDGAAAVGLSAAPLTAMPALLPSRTRERSPEFAERFAASRELPLWAETARRCLSCGACSAVCPTCYCFDVVDRVDAGGEATRSRIWDNCFFKSHALVAGGHNFRPDRAERLRFRCEHKWFGFGDDRGRAACIGCGRCRRACPVEIDIELLAQGVDGGGAP